MARTALWGPMGLLIAAAACGGRAAQSDVPPAQGAGADGSVPAMPSQGADASLAQVTTASACGPTPTTLVQPFWQFSVGQVGDIAVLGEDAYFALVSPSSLWRVPLRGGASTKLMSIVGEEDMMLATAMGLVLAESNEGRNAEIVLMSPASMTSTLAQTNGEVWSLVTDGPDLYFSDGDGIKSVPLAGGPVRMLSSQQGWITLVGSNVIVAEGSSGNVSSIPKTGGTTTLLATNQPGATHPTGCGDDVCWMTSYPCAGVPDADSCTPGEGEAAIVRMAANGSPVTLAQSMALFGPAWMTFDGTNFFAINGEDVSFDGLLSRVPGSGGDPVSIGRADSIAISESCIFAIDYMQGVFVQPTSYTP